MARRTTSQKSSVSKHAPFGTRTGRWSGLTPNPGNEPSTPLFVTIDIAAIERRLFEFLGIPADNVTLSSLYGSVEGLSVQTKSKRKGRGSKR